ncbi:MAG TPA: HD domain-containing protein, partial [Thermomicrobiales bacterium]|nr:HD domain-containing protein [Thermomicrobiales bacterium]
IPERAARVRYRIAQALAFAGRSGAPDIPARIRELADDATIAQLRRLSAQDQRHLIAVCDALQRQGASDELALAGLLHDIGKEHEGRRPSVVDRSAKVVLSRIWPSGLARFLARSQALRFGGGLWIAGNHARLGATIAEELGVSDRVVWLIAHHEDRDPTDANLRRLQQADDDGRSIPAASFREGGPRHGRDD